MLPIKKKKKKQLKVEAQPRAGMSEARTGKTEIK